MNPGPEPRGETAGLSPEGLQEIALAVAQERSASVVLRRIVEGLAARPGVALARVWLVEPGDLCGSCHLSGECPDRARCLHLVASDGRPLGGGAGWQGLDGAFRRFPLGVRKIGRIGSTGKGILVRSIDSEADWIARLDWARSERIVSFAGQPLAFRGEVLGVLGLFSRVPLEESDFRWLRAFADHAAVAIANSRAFAEIERLRERLEQENAYLRDEVQERRGFDGIVGSSAALRRVLRQVELVAPTDAGVLILGESGTGKELIARAIHERSARRGRPLIRVNCASIPRDLFESEFFGHVRGAFTGAVKDRVGRFLLADGGTLFLDEVGEIPLELQAKLLRAVQEGQFERIGDDVTRQVNARIIAATNRDLKRAVEEGRFREDLYYRLSVFPVEVPPLRERPEDVPLLAAHFAEASARRLGRPAPRLRAADATALQRYAWPGNVRELQHVIERALIVSGTGSFRIDLPEPADTASRAGERPRSPAPPRQASGPIEDAGAGAIGPDDGRDTVAGRDSSSAGEPRDLPGHAVAAGGVAGIVPEAERRRRDQENLLGALERTGWRIYGPRGAARLLGLKGSTLASRLKALGLRRPGT